MTTSWPRFFGALRAGRQAHSNASDYVRDLIRRDQEYRDKRGLLVRALVAGEDSGPSGRTVEEIWTSVKARHGAKA